MLLSITVKNDVRYQNLQIFETTYSCDARLIPNRGQSYINRADANNSDKPRQVFLLINRINVLLRSFVYQTLIFLSRFVPTVRLTNPCWNNSLVMRAERKFNWDCAVWATHEGCWRSFRAISSPWEQASLKLWRCRVSLSYFEQLPRYPLNVSLG